MGLIGSIIGLIEKVFSVVSSPQFKEWLLRKKKENPHRVKYSRDEIVQNPSYIMGDRGFEENGFNEKLYLQRDIDDKLRRIFNDKDNSSSKTVFIAGRPVSGKSRAVWELVRSDIGNCFTSVYIPKASADLNELKKEIHGLSKTTLVLFDEIEDLIEQQKDHEDALILLIAIFNDINNKNQPCIITAASTSVYFDDIKKIVTADSAQGKNKTKQTNLIEISDIAKDDDVYKWCTNNYNITKHSQTIGGYIAKLPRHTNYISRNILTNRSAAIYFTSIVILRKFRNRHKTLIDRASCLYSVIRKNDNPCDIPAPPVEDEISVLFKSGLFKKGNGVIVVNDELMYESLLGLCAQGNGMADICVKYLSNTRESEKEQIARLLDMDRTDPSIYSRIMTRSIYRSNIRDISDLFNWQFFRTKSVDTRCVPMELKPEYQNKKSEISFTISIFIGRDKFPIDRCVEYIKSGIEPNIEIVDELLRSAHNNWSLDARNEIATYAEELKKKYCLKENLFYYQLIEQMDCNYEEARIEKFLKLYPLEKVAAQNEGDRDERLEDIETNYHRYCFYLTQKADSPERLNSYFELLKKYPGLKLERQAIKRLVDKIRETIVATSLYEQLAKNLLDTPPELIDMETRNAGLICIMDNCENLNVDLYIYNRIHKEIYDNIACVTDGEMFLRDSQKKMLNIMSISLARQIRRKSRDDEHYDEIQKILKERILSSYATNDCGSADKLFNVILNNQPLIPKQGAIDNLIELYNDQSLKKEKRDIDNLNSAFENAIDAYDTCKNTEKLKEIAFTFDKLRQNSGVVMDGRYKMMMFRIMRKLNEPQDVKEIKDLINFDSNICNITTESLLENELLWCQEILMCKNVDLPLKIAEECRKLVQKDKYPVNTMNHLYSVFCDRFNNNKLLQNWLQNLEDATFDNITHTVFDYQNYLKFNAVTGKIKTVDEVQSYLENAWNKLQSLNEPLIIPSKADLLMVAISLDEVNINGAIKILILQSNMIEII